MGSKSLLSVLKTRKRSKLLNYGLSIMVSFRVSLRSKSIYLFFKIKHEIGEFENGQDVKLYSITL